MKNSKIVYVYYKRNFAGSSDKLLSAFICNYKITEAIVSKDIFTDNWKINFKLSGYPITLYTKRNKLRTFSKLESVASYLKALGVDTFSVVQTEKRGLF